MGMLYEEFASFAKQCLAYWVNCSIQGWSVDKFNKTSFWRITRRNIQLKLHDTGNCSTGVDAQQLSHQCAVAPRCLLTSLVCDIIVWVAHEIFLLGTVDFE